MRPSPDAEFRGMSEGGLRVKVGPRIAFYRRSRRSGLLSQERLAERVGISLSTLRKIEGGSRPLTIPLLEAIAKELKVGVHDLVCGVGAAGGAEQAFLPFVRLVRRHEIGRKDAEILARLVEGFWTSWVDR